MAEAERTEMMTCGELGEHFRLAALRCEPMLSEVVVSVIASSVVRAKSYIGTQQDGWEALHEATIEGFRHWTGFWIEGKRDLGYGAPSEWDPLLRTGQMRDSIDGVAEGLIGEVGSPDKIALYQEMGTPEAIYPIEPRPFLARSLMMAVPEIEALCEEVAVKLLVPGRM